MKIGISIKIDVSRLDKTRFFKGAKGTYCDLTTFIDTESASSYGDHGIISQSMSKEERDNGLKLPIVGNVKVFYKDESGYKPPVSDDMSSLKDDLDDDTIPF